MTNKEKKPREISDGARYALIGTIITAVIGLIGTSLTLYFNYLEKIETQKISLHATQTAESRILLSTDTGLNYAIMGGLLQDTCLFFDGRLEDLENKWVRISQGQDGFLHYGGYWVYGGFLRPQDFERLPVISPPPPPPTPTHTPAG